MSIELPGHNIVVPGRGVLNLDAEAVNRKIQEYDERLRFGFNEANQDWCVYIRMPRGFDAYYYISGEPVYPVLGFGGRIPSADEVLSRLHQADTMQHGMRILEVMNKENEKLKKHQDDAAGDLAGEVAERIEHEVRTEGETDKYTKVFMGG